MASSLVADYDSDEDSQEDDGSDNILADKADRKQPSKDEVNYFYNSAPGDDDSDDDTTTHTAPATKPVETVARLPNPLSGGPVDEDEDCQTSVFTNYFHRAEEKKLAVLEHHVKLTAATDLDVTSDDAKRRERNRKQQQRGVCRMFARGQCRFGDKCRFAHSSLSASTGAGSASNNDAGDGGAPGGRPCLSFKGQSTAGYGAFSTPLDLTPDYDEDSYEAQKKRKHRVGISDSLVPPKRALQTLDKMRKNERPWTSGNDD